MKAALSLLVLATFAFGAQALSLKEKKQMADWNKELTGEDGHMATVKKNCGTNIPVKLDENVITPFMSADTSAAAYCDEVVSTVATLCEDATTKEELVKKIKSISCVRGTSSNFKMNGTTLVFEMAPGTANLSEKAKKYIEGAL